MKKALIILIGLIVLTNIFCIPIELEVASAIDLPYVVIGKDLWLLNKNSGQRLFLLPESYYARIDNIDDTFYYITFNGVNGKVEKNLASTIGYHTEADGTMQELRVDAKYSMFTEIKLKSTMEGVSSDIPVPVDGSLIFIGKYPLTEEWYYVKYDNNFGYIKAEFTNKSSLILNDFIPVIKPIDISGEETIEKPESNNRVVKILVITGLSVVLIIILVVLFRPSKNNKHRYYYEE